MFGHIPWEMAILLRMRVVIVRPRKHQAALLTSVDVPAAPGRFMDLLVLGRYQIPVNEPSIDKSLFFPVGHTLESLLGFANTSPILPAECLDYARFAGKQNDGDARDPCFSVFRNGWELCFIDCKPDSLRSRDNHCGSPAAIYCHDKKAVLNSWGRLNHDQNPWPL